MLINKLIHLLLLLTLSTGLFASLALVGTGQAPPVTVQPRRTIEPAADSALARLLAGNRRFVQAQPVMHPLASAARATRLAELAKTQHPFAVILSCADSRVPPEVVFDTGMGDLFVIRNAGHVVDNATIGSIEYAAAHLDVPLLVVLGHESCGAVTAAVGNSHEAHIKNIAKAIHPAVQQVKAQSGNQIDNAVRANVHLAVNQINRSHPLLARRVTEGKFRVVGGYYNLKTGEVSILP